MKTRIKITLEPDDDKLALLKTIENTGMPCVVNNAENIIIAEKDKDLAIIAALVLNNYSFSVSYV